MNEYIFDMGNIEGEFNFVGEIHQKLVEMIVTYALDTDLIFVSPTALTILQSASSVNGHKFTRIGVDDVKLTDVNDAQHVGFIGVNPIFINCYWDDSLPIQIGNHTKINIETTTLRFY